MLTLHEWTVGIFNIQRNNLNGTSKNAHPPEGMITHKFRDYNIYKMMLSWSILLYYVTLNSCV